MIGLLKNMKRLLTYRETVNTNEFELLEGWHDQNEDKSSTENTPNRPEIEEGNEKQYLIDKKKMISKRKPIPLKDQVKKLQEEGRSSQKNHEDHHSSLNEKKIIPDLSSSLKKIRDAFHVPINKDLIIREFVIARQKKAFLVFIDGMADKNIINDYVLRQLMNPELHIEYSNGSLADYIADNILATNQTLKLVNFDAIVQQVLNGLTAIFIEDSQEVLVIESRGYEKRNVEKPSTERVIRGSQEGFTENLRTNLTLVRKIIRNKNLITEMLPVGQTNNLTCSIIYLDGIVNPALVKEVKKRIGSIDVGYILGTGMLGQLIDSNPMMPIPHELATERPDRTASYIMDGKIAIIADGTPFAHIVPVTFFDLFHNSEDYNFPWQYGTFIRFILISGILVAMLLPGIYVALTLFHQGMIPTDLLASIDKSREMVPFPVVVEVLLMELSFELIREAGIRVPGVIGPTIGIIGALVLGQAAVAADIVSPILIIVVAITGLGNFSIPNYSMAFAIRIIRFFFIILGGIAGFYGISAGIFIIGGLASSMKSFGVPYFAPIAPKTGANPDLIIRQPSWKQKERPDYLNPMDRKAEGPNPRGWVKGRRR